MLCKIDMVRKMIRSMTEDELKIIYHQYMINDFPDNERKPLNVIQSRHNKKENYCICYFEDNVMKGYSILEFCEENRSLLMDYFAIIPEYRNQGTGTRFLNEMKVYFYEWDALFIESETAVTQTAEKRLCFYQKAGALISGDRVHLYHVDYEIMCISLKRQILNHEVKELMSQLYQKIYPKVFQKLYLRWVS